MTTNEKITLANMIVCLLIAWVCICRLNVIDHRTMLRVRAKYSAILTIALTLAGLPILFQTRPTWVTALVGLLILILLLIEMPQWRHGPPHCCIRVHHK